MKRSRLRPEEPPLFDLPLDPAEREETRDHGRPAAEPDEPPREPAALDLFPADPDGGAEDGREGPETADARSPSLGDRLAAGLIDLLAHLAVLGVAAGGTMALGVRGTADHWPAYATLLLVFSFLYHTIPLAFWGRTPGMARRRLIARGPQSQPLTFGQTGLRWLGAMATVALAGLPLLLALGGRSLTDLLSGSRTARKLAER